MLNEFGAVLVFCIVGIAFLAGGLTFGYFIRLKKGSPEKQGIYECGEPTVGSAWIQYNSRFYNVALVYLLFDVEIVLLIPIALIFRDKAASGQGFEVFIWIFVFLFLLTLGLAYEWFNGNLDWIKRNTAAPSEPLEKSGA